MTIRLRFIAIPLVLALLALTASSLALADEGDIEVVQATAVSQFPDGILFSVEAESEGVIDEVRVFIKKADQSGRSSYRSIEVEPSETVSGETLLPVTGGGGDYFPPGTKTPVGERLLQLYGHGGSVWQRKARPEGQKRKTGDACVAPTDTDLRRMAL